MEGDEGDQTITDPAEDVTPPAEDVTPPAEDETQGLDKEVRAAIRDEISAQFGAFMRQPPPPPPADPDPPQPNYAEFTAKLEDAGVDNADGFVQAFRQLHESNADLRKQVGQLQSATSVNAEAQVQHAVHAVPAFRALMDLPESDQRRKDALALAKGRRDDNPSASWQTIFEEVGAMMNPSAKTPPPRKQAPESLGQAAGGAPESTRRLPADKELEAMSPLALEAAFRNRDKGTSASEFAARMLNQLH